MKTKMKVFAILLIAMGVVVSSCGDSDDNGSTNPPQSKAEEVVLVANTEGASLSFIDVHKNNEVYTLQIPNSTPADVVYSKANDKIYVGDRSTQYGLVHVIDPDTRQVTKSIEVGKGVKHMWADEMGKQLWIACDTDNVATVIDLKTETVVQTIQFEDKLHNVFVSDEHKTAYVAMLVYDHNGDRASIFSISTDDFSLKRQKDVFGSPYLFFSAIDNMLYASTFYGLVKLNGTTLEEEASVPQLQSVNGIFIDDDGAPNKDIYLASLSSQKQYIVDSETFAIKNEIASEKLTEETLGVHRIVTNYDETKLYSTYYGSSSTSVGVYTINQGALSFESEITVGQHPQGISYYQREKK